jgi:hypothetical protein
MRAKGIPKPLDCELYNEIKKYIKQLLFECIIARLLWDVLFEVFDKQFTNFEYVAS